MTLFEEIRNGLESGIEAYMNQTELRKTVITDDDINKIIEEDPKE